MVRGIGPVGWASVAAVSWGLLGCGSAEESAPVLSGVTAISAGDHFTCATLAGGSVRCWASPDVSDGALEAQTVPDLPKAVGVASGRVTACAVLGDQRVRCWAPLYSGPHFYPTEPLYSIVPDVNATTLAVGTESACALRPDGSVACWGAGMLGDGTLGYSLRAAVSVLQVSDATAIAVSHSHSSALLADGTAKWWGNTWFASEEFDSGAVLASTATPRPVDGLAGAVAIGNGFLYSCALLGTGIVECWGKIGGGTSRENQISLVPVAVRGLEGAVALSVGYSHSCAIIGDGTIRCWGSNGSGELGDGTRTDSEQPVRVVGIDHAVAVSSGLTHSCALLAEGAVSCWGGFGLGLSAPAETAPPPFATLVRAAP